MIRFKYFIRKLAEELSNNSIGRVPIRWTSIDMRLPEEDDPIYTVDGFLQQDGISFDAPVKYYRDHLTFEGIRASEEIEELTTRRTLLCGLSICVVTRV